MTEGNLHSNRNRRQDDADNQNEAKPVSLLADVLNRSCHCINVDKSDLRRTLETRLGQPGPYPLLLESHPHLLAGSPVFISRSHVDQMTEIIRAIESAVVLKGYQDLVLEWAPEIARKCHGPHGVFIGYDFHLTVDGPRLRLRYLSNVLGE